MPADRDLGRRYPERPIACVGGVIVSDRRRVVLVRRRYPPLAGRWTLPGGALELGETLVDGLQREVREETGLEIHVGPVIEVFDHLSHDEHDRVEYHYVIADYLCRERGGTLGAGSDVDEVVRAEFANLDSYNLTERAQVVIRRGLELVEAWGNNPGA